MEASWTYGFCRVAPNAQTALVFLSKLPWHEAFYKMLNHAAELITYHSQDELFSFLHASHICKVPENGQMFHVSWLTDKNVMSDFAVETPHQLNLPTLPENVSHLVWKNAPNALKKRNLEKFLIFGSREIWMNISTRSNQMKWWQFSHHCYMNEESLWLQADYRD